MTFLAPDVSGSEPRILVTSQMFEVWYGPLSRTINVRTNCNEFTCSGHMFKKDEEYFVAATRAPEPLAGGAVEAGGE